MNMTKKDDINNNRHCRFLNDIPRGKENAVSRETLAALWGTDVRGVSTIIADLRNQGELIASSGAGIYFPGDIDELAEFYRTARRRALSILKTLKTSRRELKNAGRLV